MIKKTGLFQLIIVFGLIFSYSCVSSKQFKEVQEQGQKYQDERDMLKAENEKLSVENTELGARIKNLKSNIKKMVNDSSDRAAELKSLQRDYQRIRRDFLDLQNSQEELVKGNNRETRRLLKQLQVTQEDLQTREDQLRELEKTLNAKKRNLEELQYEVEKRNEKLTELENMLNQKDQMMKSLKKAVSDALLGFENSELTVTHRDGKIYVSLEEKLLFKTGSWAVDPRGVEAITSLARVLQENPNINVMIEGHTDNVPYRSNGKQIQDNWDLSVKRATSIVRILLKNSFIDPKRITAAGRGEFFPVDSSNTPEARRKNRRTEIILAPDYSKLYNLIGE